MRNFVLDSFALLAYLEDEPGAEKVERLLGQAEKSKNDLVMSIVNWGEVYYSLYRSKGVATAEDALLIIDQLPITLVDVKRDFMYVVAQIKARHSIALGDCFAAALAIEQGMPIITGDKEFEKLGDQIDIEWLK
jgi:ribonuclease VapC